MTIGMRGGVRLAAFGVMACLALAGCREEEQDRILLFEQGTYKGTPDDALDESQVGDLRSRALRQQY